MQTGRPTIFYKRSHFVTHLPVDYVYSPTHCWAARDDDDFWRVGFTKFATRMLGDMVDHGFEVEPPTAVKLGQIIGWVEGFKAITDLFCIAEGEFAGGNAALKNEVSLISEDPYNQGWLYRVQGRPDERCVDVQAYREILDQTIDRILEKQKNEEIK